MTGQQPELWPCPRCQARIPPTSTFCPSCGLQLAEGERAVATPAATATPRSRWSTRKKVAVGIIAVVVILMAFGVARGPQRPGETAAPGAGIQQPRQTRAPVRATPTPTYEQMLAVIHGDPSTAGEFGRLLDRIQAGGGTCAPEPDRQRVADVLYASWDEAGRPDTLLKWAQTLAAICG